MKEMLKNNELNKSLSAITRQTDLLYDKFKVLTGIAGDLNSLLSGIQPAKGKSKGIDSMNRNIETLKTAKEIEDLDSLRLQYANGMWNDFQQMLQATGLMKGQFGEIIQIINSVISGVSGGFSFFDTLVGFIGSFIPGGNAIGALSGNMQFYPNRPHVQPVNVSISGNLTRLGEYSVTVNGNDLAGRRGSRNI